MCLHRETGALCYMLSARKLSIALGDRTDRDTPAHWRWIPVTGSRFAMISLTCWNDRSARIFFEQSSIDAIFMHGSEPIDLASP